MYCNICGEENSDDAKVCKLCGQKLTEDEPEAVGEKEQPAQKMRPMKKRAKKEKTSETETEQKKGQKTGQKKLPIRVLVPAAALILLAGGVCYGRANAKVKIDLNEYQVILEEGYDGYGTAFTSVNWDAIRENYGEKLKFSSKAKKELGIDVKEVDPVDFLQSCVSVGLEEDYNLLNGQTIHYSWYVDEVISEALKCQLRYEDGDYSVSNLQAIEYFNPFDDLQVFADGVSTAGEAYVEYSGPVFTADDFSFSQKTGLSNGDTILISVPDYGTEYYLNNYGLVPEQMEAGYEISNLPEYLQGTESVSEEQAQYLFAEVEDEISAYIANELSDYAVSPLSYAGYIYRSLKETESGNRNRNEMDLIYSVIISDPQERFRPTTVFMPVRFENLQTSGEGLSYQKKTEIQGSSRISGDISVNVKGYLNPYLLYQNLAEAQRDHYICEYFGEIEAYTSANSVRITKPEDLSEELKEELREDAETKILTYVDKNYNSECHLSELEYAADLLLVLKNQGNDDEKNSRYYVIFKADLSNEKEAFAPTTVYFPVEYDGILKLLNNTYQIIKPNGIAGNSRLKDSSYSTKGYEDPAQLIKELVTDQNKTYLSVNGLKLEDLTGDEEKSESADEFSAVLDKLFSGTEESSSGSEEKKN